MLAVNRHYGRSDYLPCICWGMKARQAANWQVGTSLRLEGRLQSRSYIKLTEEGASQRVAFEVSVTEIEELLSAEKSSI
jgi:single-stranded DNA-binding protein